jgi:hypothetical protein
LRSALSKRAVELGCRERENIKTTVWMFDVVDQKVILDEMDGYQADSLYQLNFEKIPGSVT